MHATSLPGHTKVSPRCFILASSVKIVCKFKGRVPYYRTDNQCNPCIMQPSTNLVPLTSVWKCIQFVELCTQTQTRGFRAKMCTVSGDKSVTTLEIVFQITTLVRLFCESSVFHIYLGLAVAQVVSRWLPTAAARVRVRAACGVCGGKSGIGACFLRVLRFPLPIIPPISPSS
jgi:hypothetical protein